MKYHKTLTEEKWFAMGFPAQMANVGGEVGRVIRWRGKNEKNFQQAFYRAHELLVLTMKDPKNKHGLKELARVKEGLSDWFLGNLEYNTSDGEWDKYFLEFNLLVRSE